MTAANDTITSLGTRALEDPNFPFEHFSSIAELESWRKEIHRPIYHLHKWWAQRLGSVFRAILIGAMSGSSTDMPRAFYSPLRLNGVIFDPFMGSGTTVGEALKLGLRAVGRDINPVSHFIVRVALGRHPKRAVQAEFAAIERDVASQIKHYYKAVLPDGRTADVLYYFWVKIVRCPECAGDVDLFSSYLFAKNAYAKRKPTARVVCPNCGDVSTATYGETVYDCQSCGSSFNPMEGPARGSKARCGHCGSEFAIVKAVQKEGRAPRHRMYAKLVLDEKDGSKTYLRTDGEDERIYADATETLKQRPNAYPLVALADGYNTRQVLNYCYGYWHEMFNDRQLLCLSILADRVGSIEDPALRELFTALFSGVLEFNNMFASYKGEGTGAVRHMFSHHILKPEKMPLEAHPWGTPKSSGSFTTLFKSRVLRAIDYAENPFEVEASGKGRKVYGLSMPLGRGSADSFRDFDSRDHDLYLSCGDSANTDLADRSVDAVVTDPPFFDNVHYSELADFFYVWQQYVLRTPGANGGTTTRRIEEVQSRDADIFARRLDAVFTECRRVLKDDGVLAFTYHHSRAAGWRAVLKAVMKSGFGITAVQPIKSEMSVATPKSQANNPIDVDVIIVCRKSQVNKSDLSAADAVLKNAEVSAENQVARFATAGRKLGYGDIRVILTSHVVRQLSMCGTVEYALGLLERIEGAMELSAARLHTANANAAMPARGQMRFAEFERVGRA